MSIEVTSSAFTEGSAIPVRHTCDGEDVSPPLSWSGVPQETRGLALISDDPDAPGGTWVHWVYYAIPADANGLPEGIADTESLPDGAMQGRNDFKRTGYGGPCPPRIAVVATVGRTGMPQLTPNWYRFADGRLTVSTTKERIKYQNLSRDPRLAVCVYSEPRAKGYAVLRGLAEINDDESIWPETEAIVARYTEADKVDARMRTLRTQNRVIISLVPERVHYEMF